MNKAIASLLLMVLVSACAIFDPNHNKKKLEGPRLSVAGFEAAHNVDSKSVISCEQFNKVQHLHLAKSKKIDRLQSSSAMNPLLSSGDTLIAMTSYGRLIAYDADLQQKWLSRHLEGAYDGLIVGEMSHDEKDLYLTIGNNTVSKFDLLGGQHIWSTKLDDIARSAPLIHADKVFIHTANNQLYALERLTGKIIWRHMEAEQPLSMLSNAKPVVIGNYVLMQVSNATVVALDVNTGEVMLDMTLVNQYGITGSHDRRRLLSFGVTDGQNLYSVSKHGELIALDITEQAILWKVKAFPAARFLIDSNLLYVVTEQSQIIAINKQTGETVWSTLLVNCANKGKGTLWVAPLVYNDVLILTSYDGSIVAVDKNSGHLLWSQKGPDMVAHAPIVMQGKLYFYSNNGSIYSYSTRLPM